MPMTAAEIFEEFGTDHELEAECRVLGTLLADSTWLGMMPIPIPPLGFCFEFHRAVYFTILALATAEMPVTPKRVWHRVCGHSTADDFGLEQLVDLHDNAHSPQSFVRDVAILQERGYRRLRATLLMTPVAEIMH